MPWVVRGGVHHPLCPRSGFVAYSGRYQSGAGSAAGSTVMGMAAMAGGAAGILGGVPLSGDGAWRYLPFRAGGAEAAAGACGAEIRSGAGNGAGAATVCAGAGEKGTASWTGGVLPRGHFAG